MDVNLGGKIQFYPLKPIVIEGNIINVRVTQKLRVIPAILPSKTMIIEGKIFILPSKTGILGGKILPSKIQALMRFVHIRKGTPRERTNANMGNACPTYHVLFTTATATATAFFLPLW